MNNPFSGGWRFGTRPTSVEALYQPKPIDNDFLRRVAALGQDPDKKGLLEQVLTATPLQGLLDAPGASGYGDMDQRAGGRNDSGGSAANHQSIQGMMDGPLGVMAGRLGNKLDAIGLGMDRNRAVSVVDGVMRSVADIQAEEQARLASIASQYAAYNNPNAGGLLGNNYGSSATLNGPPDAAAAQALADQLAAQLAAYAIGGGGGGGFSASPGVGGLEAGGSPDGYW